jgi:4-amino-4-deoxy-L-arabinose transferase-like glycosyltransferase
MIVGMIQISKLELPSSPPTVLGQWLNDTLHFEIPSIDNVLFGLPILILGIFLLAVSLIGLRILPAEKDFSGGITFGFRFVSINWLWLLVALNILLITLWSLAKRDYSGWMIAGVLISLLIILTVIAAWDHKRGINLSPNLTRTDFFWILGLFFIGILIGVYRLQAVPDSLIGDDGSFWTAARDIANGSFRPPIFGVGVFTFPIFSSYLQAWFLDVFGITLWGWRMSSVLSGLVTILPLYLLAKDAFNRKIAITSCLALIFSPYFLAFSRLGYISIQALFITTLALYWLYIGLNRDSHLYLFLAGCASGMGFYTFFAARIALLIGIAFIGLMWIGRKIIFRKALFALGLLLLGAFICAGPYLSYGLTHDAGGMSYKIFESLFFNKFNGGLFYSDQELFAFAPPIQVNGNILFFNPKIYMVLIARGLSRTLLAFIKPGLITEHYIATSLTGTVGAIFFLIGLGITIWKFRQPRFLLLSLWFFGVVFGLSALNTVPPRHTHMVSIIPVLALLIGIGLWAIASTASTFLPKLVRINNLFLPLITSILCVGGMIDFFISMPKKYHPQPEQIMSWATLSSQDETFYYIYTRPDEKGYKPYIVTEFLPSVPFNSISADSLPGSLFTSKANDKTIVFYPPSLSDDVKSILQNKWGNLYYQKTFYSTDGIPVLSAGMNNPFIFVRDQSIFSVLKDSFLRPSILILFGLLFGFGTIIYFSTKIRLPILNVWMVRLSNWFNSPGQPDSQEEKREVLLGEPVEIIIPEIPVEPPVWAEQVLLSNTNNKSKSIQTEFRHVASKDGKDYYLRVHLAPLRLFGHPSSDRAESVLPKIEIPNPLLLVAAVLLSICAQIMIGGKLILSGLAMYTIGVLGLIVWIRINPKWKNIFTNQWRISRRIEILLISILMAGSTFIRFFYLSSKLHGLSLDEIKWTIQSWYSTILQVNRGELITQYASTPLSFWIRSIFLHVFGLNFLSPRIESVISSLLSILLLYLLVHKLTSSKSLALTATLFYSISFAELSLSQQALGQTSSQLFIIASIFFLIKALQERKTWQFQVTGLLFALGMITFELFLPALLLGVIYLICIGFYEVIKKKTSSRKWVEYLFFFSWPIVLIYLLYTQNIGSLLRENYFGILNQFSINGSKIGGLFLFFFKNLSEVFQTIFSQVSRTDPLVNWSGPLVNPFFLPFVVIGCVYNFWNIRRPFYAVLPFWFIIYLVLVPISLGIMNPGYLYPLLVPIIVWGAMGLWVFLGVLRAWINNKFKPSVVLIFILCLSVITFYDYHIFSSMLIDPLDQQKLLELSRLTSESTGKDPIILYPNSIDQSSPPVSESEVILLSAAGRDRVGRDPENQVKQMDLDQLLASLWDNRQYSSLDLILDANFISQDQTKKYFDLILNCYPDASLSDLGTFYRVYHFSKSALIHPKCYQSATPVPVTPTDKASIQVNDPISFAWETDDPGATSFALTVERKIEGTFFIEAEDSFKGTGWSVSSDFVQGFTGSGFILDDWHAGEAHYSLILPKAGQYRIWIKSYKRRINDQLNFITINGAQIEFAGDNNPLNEWVWDDIGVYDLPPGPLPITLSRTYGTDEQYSVFIDSLLITTDLASKPELVKVWDGVINTGEIMSSSNSYMLPDMLPPGEYRWKVRIFNGNYLISSANIRGVESPFTSFTVNP